MLELRLGTIEKVDDTIAIIKAISDRLKGRQLRIPKQLGLQFNHEELGQLDRGIRRLKVVGEQARDQHVAILVDAEYVAVNSSISILTLAMMDVFNHDGPVVWTTFQCYLKAAYENVQRELAIVTKLGVYFGAKIVRGAYLASERSRAQGGNYPDPTNVTYEATNAMYDRVMSFFIDYIGQNPHKCSIIIATHNEESVRLAIQNLAHAEIAPNVDSVTFAQLYGMCDQITYPLAQRGYGVYKSMPFGTVEDVMPYLYRRAMENVDVLKGSRKEVKLLREEVKYRLKKSLGLKE